MNVILTPGKYCFIYLKVSLKPADSISSQMLVMHEQKLAQKLKTCAPKTCVKLFKFVPGLGSC